MDMSFGKMLSVIWKMSSMESSLVPVEQFKTVPFLPEEFSSLGPEIVAATWFGHSSMLIRINGKTFLTDPVFSERASMFPFMGPKHFNYDKHMDVESLPAVDAVLISHDHYDHLDYETIMKLKEKVNKFYVPLGVGAHLESWGVPKANITELDWWDSTTFNADIQLVFTPTRHFSGRGFKRNLTLWGSWVIKGKEKRVYFSGDSGYFPGFKTIGDKYGPFDLTMLEDGAYNEDWKAIHMLPEESVQAGIDLQTKLILPIHWGKFNLSLHHWKDPIERITKEAERRNVKIATPQIGEMTVIERKIPIFRWWDGYK